LAADFTASSVPQSCTAQPGEVSLSHLNDQIVRLYDTVFDRAPDAGGLEFWNGATHRGLTMGDMADLFITAPEFASTYGQPTSLGFVQSMYQNVLAACRTGVSGPRL
jgi:hypothetical protein